MDLVNSPLVSPSPSPAAQALSDRMVRLQRASLEKRAALEGRAPEEQLAAEFERDRQSKTIAELRAIYGNDAAEYAENQRRLEAQEMDDRLRDRAGMEGGQDATLSMARTSVQLGGGGLGLAVKLGSEVGPGALIQDLAESGVFGEAYAEQSRKVKRQITESISNTTARIDAALARRMSRVSQANERAVGAEIAAAEARNLAEYERDVAAGTPGWMAGIERELSNLGTAAGATLRNPTVLSNMVVGQLPTLGIGLGARAAVTTGQVAARAALLAERKAIREGMGTFGVTAAKVTDDLTSQAQRQLMTRNFMLGTGAAEGGGVYQQGTAEILAMSPEQLAAEFPEHAERLAADPENTRAELGSEVGLRAATIQALLAGLTSRVAARFETDPVGAGLDGATTAVERLSANVANVVQQGIEETIQSGGGEFAVNAANASAGREGVDLLARTGAGAGQGLVGGLGMAGALQAPSMAFNAAGVALNTGLDVGKLALGELMAVGKARREGAQAPVREQAAAVTARRAEVSSEVDTELKDLGQSLPADSAVDAQVRTELGAEGLGKVSTLSRVIEAIKTEEDPAKLNQYRIFGVKTARELSQAQSQITARLEAETDPEARQRLETLNLEINELVSDESIQEMEAAMKEVPVEAIEQVFANLPADIDTAGIQANPEVMRTLDLVREMSYAAPAKITPAVAQRARMLFQQTGGATPQDQAQLETVEAVGQVSSEYQAQVESIKAKYPKLKGQDVVQKEILDDGFQVGGQHLRSVSQHVGAVSSALGAGDKQLAALELARFAKFANHMADKAAAFDAAAIAQLDAGKEDAWFPVPGFKRLASASGLSKKDHAVNLLVENSRGNIDWVFADAYAVTQAYNALAKANPELIQLTAQDKAPLPARIQMEAPRPTWTQYTPKKEAPNAAVPVADPAPVAGSNLVDGGAREAAPAEATETVVGDVQEAVPAPATTAPKVVSRITVEQAKSLSDAGLNDRINALMDKRTAKTNTAEDDATFDLLDNEMTARETALSISDFAPAQPAAPVTEEIPEAGAEGIDERAAASETTESGTDDAAALAQILTEAQAALAAGRGEIEARVPDTRTLDDLAAMTEDEYIAAVNPTGKRLTDEEVRVLTAMAGIDLPEDAEAVAEITDKNGKTVAVYRDADGNRYAVENGKVLAAVVDQDGSTLSHTLPAGRGRKLGQALMVEYLREFPFAQSGGFSDAGEKARRAAFRALSGKSPMQSRFRSLQDLVEGTPEELAERQAKDAALQTKYPNREPFDFSPELETLRRRNQWLHGFSLRNDFAGALRNGLDGLQKQVAGLLGQKGVGADEHTALKALSEAVIPGVVQLLQAQVTKKAAADKRLAGTDPQLWQLNDKLSLHATNYGQGQPLAYDPAIAEGMASAGMLWMMETLNKEYPHDDDYVAGFLKKLPEDLLPAEKAVFQDGQLQEAMVTELVRTLSSVLGITPNADASVTENDGLLQVLAADTINILIDEGNLIQTKHFLLQESVANPDGSSTYVSRLIPAADVDGHNARAKAGAKVTISQFYTLSHKREGGLADLRKQLGPVGLRRLSSLLDPAREQSWQFGEPGTMTEKKVRGSDQDLSKEQREILRNQNAVVFKRNNAMVQWLMKLGREQALALFGVDPALDMEELNKVDRFRMKGIHKGWHRAWDTFEDWHGALLHESELRGVSPDDLPTHFRHYITSNNRVMVDDSANPQSNKLLREIMMATISTMELGNEQHETALRLMVGQALEAAGVDGVPKIENAGSHAEIVAAVDKLMAEDGPLYEVWTTLVQDDFDAGMVMNQMVKAGFKADGSAVKAFNALHAWAAYDLARSRGDKTVDVALAFEQDGKTDGAANAMGQLGLHRLSETLFLNLDRAGYFIGREETALGDVAEELGDLYGAVAEGANGILHTKLKQLREQYADQNLPPIARETAEIQGRGLAGAIRLFARVGWFGGLSRDGLGDLTESKAKRSFGKVAVIPIGYGGGAGSVAGALSRDLLEHLYAELSKGIQTGLPIPDALANSINALITHQLYMEEVKGRRYLRAKEVAKPFDFSDISKYKELELSPVHLRALNSHMVYGAAGALRKSIGEQMDSTLEGMGKLIAAANLQSAVLQYEFDKAYAARRTELIKTKQILPEQALSRNQEKELLRDLVPKLAPIVQFKSTVAEGSEQVGLNMAETDRNAVISEAHERGVESLFGGLSTNVSRMGFAEPGVRAGALTIIGGGDATMMGIFFNKIRQFLNVWDGLETPLVELFSAGREINQAVYDAWQHDLLGEVNKQFQSKVDELYERIATDPNLEALLERKLKLKPTDENPNPMFGYLTELASTLDTMAKETRLVKRAMGELGISIDHMAGARRPFVKDGIVVPREQLVSWLNDRVEQLRAQDADIAATPASEAVVGEGESPRSRSFDQILLTPRADLPAITKILEARLAKEGNKVQQFVWQHIKPLLPTDLVVHRGTVSELRDRMREVFPDIELPAGRIEGGYLQGHVFLANDSTETLMHELVHAAVTGLVDRYYTKGKGLTAHQRDAVVQLEALTREFMLLDPAELNPFSGQAVDNAQRTIGSLLEQGDVAGAVNEYLAWTLTSRDISSALQRRKAPYGLGHLAQVVRKLVRKLLGLPNNPTVTTYLEATLGQFHRLTRVGRTLEGNPRGRMLYQLLQRPGSTGQSSHEVHLRAVYDELQVVLGAVPPHQVTTKHHDRIKAEAEALAEQQRDAFLAAGFPLSKQEQMVFELTQAMFASSLPLDPRVMIALQHLQNAAVKTLAVEDFMVDPSSTDPAARAIAQDQYNAVFGSAALAMDAAGRSTQLANFVALALVHEPLRAKLNQLSMPKPVEGEKTADGQLRAWTTRLFDRVTNASLGLSSNLSQRAAVDLLITRLSQIQVKWARTARSTPSAFDRLEARTRERLAKIGSKADRTLQARQARGLSGGMNGFVNLTLNSIRAMTTEEGAWDFGEDVLAATSHLPKELRELFAEIVGGTTVTRPIHELLNQARSKVDQVRKRLREEAPQHVRGLFSKELSEQTWGRLVRSVAKSDLQALLGNYSGNQIQGMFEDRAKLDTEILRLEGLLQARPEWVRSADNLAHYMMTGTQLVANGPLYRNAAAIARQPGFGRSYDADTKKITSLIDRLVTLKAMTYLDVAETSELADLFRTERTGVEGLIKLMRRRVVTEQGKHHSDRQRYNQWKGYVPVSMDPRRDVVLAGPKRGAELVAQGYIRLQAYNGDTTDPSYRGLAYYAISSAGGHATYNQGALQTVEGSVMGVDYLTGATLDSAVQALIKDPKVVAKITAAKMRMPRAMSEYSLVPVFDEQGVVVAYERPLSKQILDQHLSARPDLAQSIGMWMGRQAEEEIAREFNGQVVAVLKKTWDDFKGTNRAGEFVDITDPKAPATLRDTWNTIPRETQTMLLQEFGGAVMVREGMLNNALGYRSASVGDAFLGMGDLPKDVREGIVNVASALLGKNAYRYLVTTERSWQDLVGLTKDVILVRSGVVALANGISNQFQLVMHEVPVTKLLPIQAAKVAETKSYLRNAHRIARIQVELDSTTDPGKRRGLELERQGLHDQNRRLSIWPLIKAGELQTIVEGLTEQDEYSLLGDAIGWLEKKAENLPQGVVTAARYAVISKDTALYQGMNRMIQFSDFAARAALYDHLMQQRGLDHTEALRIISERFVNYNLLAGRSRDYLESMGLTWFMAYKVRIQKVVLSTLRENPLRFLMAGAGAEWLGANSLMSSSFPLTHWESAIGPGMFFRADEAIMWNQLMH